MPKVTIDNRKLTIQMPKYSPAVPENRTGATPDEEFSSILSPASRRRQWNSSDGYHRTATMRSNMTYKNAHPAAAYIRAIHHA